MKFSPGGLLRDGLKLHPARNGMSHTGSTRPFLKLKERLQQNPEMILQHHSLELSGIGYGNVVTV